MKIDFQARLCMFPEGTRSGGEKLLPFKKGAFHVAVGSNLPIQPVVVSRFYFIDSKRKHFNPGTFLIPERKKKPQQISQQATSESTSYPQYQQKITQKIIFKSS